MKTIKAIVYGILVCSLFLVYGCENVLQEEPYSQISPDKLLTSKDGLTSLLASAYGNANITNRRRVNDLGEWMTGLSWQTGGGENRTAVPIINFSWDASYGLFNEWYNTHYRAIRDANTLIENIDLANLSESEKQQFLAEARFVRAFSYIQLRKMFGTTPLRTSTEDPLELPRASQQEMRSFIESELTAIIPQLPAPQEQVYGRATNGAARGVLCKFYLNTKQWQKAADMAQAIIDMGYYELFPNYMDMLKVKNEGNREMIWAYTAHPSGPANLIQNATFPPGFQSWPRTGLEMQANWNNWASQYRLRDDFYNSFEPGDERQDPIMTKYVNAQGDTVDLLNDFEDNTRAFRYWPDPNAQGNRHGNDFPVVRYADILLSRAEALNELNGPNQESIDLINQVRNRAGLDDLQLANFTSKKRLRNHILQERAWEFYYEGLRREDLIRHGKFVEQAQARGKNAQPYHVLFPIPQSAMDSNPKLEQNPGY